MLVSEREHVKFDERPPRGGWRCDFSKKNEFRGGGSAGLQQNGAGNGDLSAFCGGCNFFKSIMFLIKYVLIYIISVRKHGSISSLMAANC